MTCRSVETWIAYYTIFSLVIYVPLETWASWPYGLTNPFYIVDVIAMVLLLCGAWISLRARPQRAPEVLCAAYAWTSANGWRATFDRVAELNGGGELEHGGKELLVVGGSTAIALVVFGVLLGLVVKKLGSNTSND